MKRTDLRNVAIIAHVDHGKTTLVNELLKQGGIFRDNQEVLDRVMDSGDLERERGITILAKNTSVHYKGVKINVIDTPGYFDFAGEVMSALTAADFGIIVVSAKDGLTVGAERAWKRLKGAGVPFMFYISKIDEDNSDCHAVINQIRQKYGTPVRI